MDEDDAAGPDCFVDEAAGSGEPDEEVLVLEVLDWDAEVPDAGLGMLGRDGIGADGDDVRDTALGDGAGRLGGDKAGRKVKNPLRRDSVGNRSVLSEEQTAFDDGADVFPTH